VAGHRAKKFSTSPRIGIRDKQAGSATLGANQDPEGAVIMFKSEIDEDQLSAGKYS
jgi:hypothetical protein